MQGRRVGGAIGAAASCHAFLSAAVGSVALRSELGRRCLLLKGRLAAKAGHEALLLLLLLLLLHGQVLLVLLLVLLLHLLLLVVQLLLLLVVVLLLLHRMLLLLVEHRGQLARRAAALGRADVVAAGGAPEAGRGGAVCRHQVLVIAVGVAGVAAGGQQQGHGEGQLDGRRAALRRLRCEGRGGRGGGRQQA